MANVKMLINHNPSILRLKSYVWFSIKSLSSVRFLEKHLYFLIGKQFVELMLTIFLFPIAVFRLKRKFYSIYHLV